ncbi:pb-fam-5 protein [Cystoisospora suis]|uniref:Pb-fam-5 protein n=1 Tax=Cystoisospora suis TaxID=483139 RepID=A0A2C6LES9_9APIC|nr:pb-fam-5 protein [Cystoisospora suis]
MKRAWEEACEAYFPVSVMAAAPKLSAFFPRQEVLQVEGRGPVGSAGTRYAGNVLEPNGTVYLPSRQYQVHSPSDSQPKSPDLTATDASLTQEHIDRLETLKARTTDPQLRTAIEDAIEELSAQGGSTEIVYA